MSGRKKEQNFDTQEEELHATRSSKTGSGLILPESLRQDLKDAFSDLGLSQKGASKEAHVSEALVSNLLSGHLRVRDSERVARLTAVLEQRVNERSEKGYLEDKRLGEITLTIGNLKAIYGIGEVVLNSSTQLAQTQVSEAMERSLRVTIDQSILFAQVAKAYPSAIDQARLALRMSQLFNQTAQAILRSQKDVFPQE